jgi:hypothetical protein
MRNVYGTLVAPPVYVQPRKTCALAKTMAPAAMGGVTRSSNAVVTN